MLDFHPREINRKFLDLMKGSINLQKILSLSFLIYKIEVGQKLNKNVNDLPMILWG